MDKIIKFFKKLGDTINTQIKAKTGMDFNFGAIFLAIFMLFIIILIVKGVLGWVRTSLMG